MCLIKIEFLSRWFAKVGKAQLEAQIATSTNSAIAEVALHFKFLFQNIAKVALRTKI